MYYTGPSCAYPVALRDQIIRLPFGKIDAQWRTSLEMYFPTKYLGAMFRIIHGESSHLSMYEKWLVYDELNKKLFYILNHTPIALNLTESNLAAFIRFYKGLLQRKQMIAYLPPATLNHILTTFCTPNPIRLFNQSKSPDEIFVQQYQEYKPYFKELTEQAFLELMAETLHDQKSTSLGLTAQQSCLLIYMKISVGHFDYLRTLSPDDYQPLLLHLAKHGCLMPIEYFCYLYSKRDNDQWIIDLVIEAAQSRQFEIVDYFYHFFHPLLEDMLYCAIQSQKTDIVKYFLPQNILTPNTLLNLLKHASRHGSLELVSLLSPLILETAYMPCEQELAFQVTISDAFRIAATYGHQAILEFFIDYLTYPQYVRFKPSQEIICESLDEALQNGHYSIVLFLIKKEKLHYADNQTFIKETIQNDNLRSFIYLCYKLCYSPNASTKIQSAYLQASLTDNLQLICLIEQNSHMGITSQLQYAALCKALFHEKSTVAQYFLCLDPPNPLIISKMDELLLNQAKCQKFASLQLILSLNLTFQSKTLKSVIENTQSINIVRSIFATCEINVEKYTPCVNAIRYKNAEILDYFLNQLRGEQLDGNQKGKLLQLAITNQFIEGATLIINSDLQCRANHEEDLIPNKAISGAIDMAEYNCIGIKNLLVTKYSTFLTTPPPTLTLSFENLQNQQNQQKTAQTIQGNKNLTPRQTQNLTPRRRSLPSTLNSK